MLLIVLFIGGGWFFQQRLTLLEERLILLSVQLRLADDLNRSLEAKVNHQLIPTGTVIGYTGPLNATIRQQLQQVGWLMCDGSDYPIADYPALYQVIQSFYGPAAEKTFKVPDFRGIFLRGLDSDKGYDIARTLGSYQADANKTHTHSGEIEPSGNHQHQAISQPAGDHQHLLEAKGYWYTSKQKNERPAMTQEVDDNQKYWTTPAGEHHHEITIEANGEHRHTLVIASQGEIEARPKNYPVIYLIKY
ncbi:MAG: hypothetical protein BWK79_16570 [Beggiatoa sp. IS2]|nr:MAG: hypothetical protein BWK79_16570 [Beggiatoa sp. IS2]